MSDELTIPDFLVRTQTPEQAKRIKKLTAQYRERRIKNPPKRWKKTGLGAAFGSKVRST